MADMKNLDETKTIKDQELESVTGGFEINPGHNNMNILGIKG